MSTDNIVVVDKGPLAHFVIVVIVVVEGLAKKILIKVSSLRSERLEG